MSHIRPLTLLRGALLATCSGLAIAIAAPAAQAAPTVGVSFTYTIENGLPTTFSDTSSTSLAVNPSGFAGSSNISGSHWGSPNGVFGSRSAGNGVYDNFGSSSWSDSFTNNGSQSVNLVASFLIEQGSISVFAGQTGTVAAGVSAVILVNNTEVFSSVADMQVVAGGMATLVKGGQDLAPSNETLAVGNGDYFWGTYLGTIDLGLVAPGATVEIDYILRS